MYAMTVKLNCAITEFDILHYLKANLQLVQFFQMGTAAAVASRSLLSSPAVSTTAEKSIAVLAAMTNKAARIRIFIADRFSEDIYFFLSDIDLDDALK